MSSTCRRTLARTALVLLLAAVALPASSATSAPFDHSHSLWNELLRAHVVEIRQGRATEVDYAGFQRDEAKLGQYLDSLSAVTAQEYASWSREQQMAFLINAYNAFTVRLILTEYPGVSSIRRLGGPFRSPWKLRFFTLLGERRHLDWVEHERLREPGVFNEPRIHFAVNCASIGCPALRPEAFVAERLDAQLEDAMRRFLADGTRNYYDAQRGRLQISKIFEWYRQDFEGRAGRYASLPATLADFAEALSDDPAVRAAIRSGDVPIGFADYDWSLNDLNTTAAR